ncbi:MAG TPA: glycosyltransferase family 87 protein [Candidatus Dormibacteraeota bacterium]
MAALARQAAAPLVGLAAVVLAVLNLRVIATELIWGSPGPGGLGEDFWSIYTPAAELPAPLYRMALEQLKNFAADPQPVAIGTYPPIDVVLARPLTLLPWRPALAVWLAASLVAVVVTWWLVVRLTRSGRFGAALALVIAFAPDTWWAFHEGQINLLLLPVLTGAAVAAGGGRSGLAGALIGVAGALKGYPALIGVYFLFARDWRGMAWCFGVGAGLTAAGFLATWPASLDYLTRLLPVQLAASPGFVNHGLPAVARRYFEPNLYGTTVVASPLLSFITGKLLPLGLVAASLWAVRGRPAVSLLALTALLPALTTTSWISTAVLASPALMAGLALAAGLGEAGRAGKLLLAAGALLTQLSPLLRALEVPFDSIRQAVATHDQLFYAWNLDLTAGYLCIWGGWLLVSRVARASVSLRPGDAVPGRLAVHEAHA